jgi:xanthine/CO dehydrogenase XdhC/CoxF family maturation factor
VDCSVPQLVPPFLRARAQDAPLVIATLVATSGSTYRKAGAQIAIEANGSCSGLLSGGCLEADLAEHARTVFDTGAPRRVEYRVSPDDDAIWGMGSGCEGVMEIWLTRHGPQDGWHPLPMLMTALERRAPATWALVTESADPAVRPGDFVVQVPWDDLAAPRDLPPDTRSTLAARLANDGRSGSSGLKRTEEPRIEWCVSSLVLPRRLLVLGAGPDAMPVVQYAALLGWRVSVYDHRPAYASAAFFPAAATVTAAPAADLAGCMQLDDFDAVVVMSHHLTSDLAYLRALVDASPGYVGLLGPAARRKRLLDELGASTAARFDGRLRAPIGLDLGGRDPASIALAIVAQIQAHFHGRDARSVDWSVPGER